MQGNTARQSVPSVKLIRQASSNPRIGPKGQRAAMVISELDIFVEVLNRLFLSFFSSIHHYPSRPLHVTPYRGVQLVLQLCLKC